MTIPLALVGCDFRRASSRFRSMLVLDQGEARELADSLRQNGWAEGLMLLETCNRNEWVVSTDSPEWAAELLLARMKDRLGPEGRERVTPYVFTGDAAARHLLMVAIGQESLVQGERQVASQLQRALDAARAGGRSCRTLNGLGSIAGRLVTIAARRGVLRDGGAGVHRLALDQVARHVRGRGRREVAIVGLGTMGRKVAAGALADPDMKPVLVNRTAPEGVTPLTDLHATLERADAAVFCTAAPHPVLDPSDLPPRGRDNPLLLVDIGIPHQVERAPLPEGVILCGLDDLVCSALSSRGGDGARDTKQDEAGALVERASRELARFCSEPVFAGILEEVRTHHRRLTRETIPGLVEADGLEPEQVSRLKEELHAVLGRYTNDIMRAVRQATAQGGEKR